MPHASQATLQRMRTQLASGPILVGENHTRAFGREAIIQLLVNRAISFLSIEGPVVPRNIARADGQIQRGQLARYCAGWDEMHNPHYSLARLAGIAMDRRVPVYFHDMPHQYSRLRQVDPTYIAYAQQFGRGFPRLPDGLGNMLQQRNRFSARFLTHMLGRGVRVLQGLVILAGDDHLEAVPCGGLGDTIQGLLGIGPARVHHLT